ncbi:unnamed protein product [Amoebophrya sp. A120]|nr:unnamed protein product [Amoebophrya sp. A120]|eukprot:GSA120T00019562001.1
MQDRHQESQSRKKCVMLGHTSRRQSTSWVMQNMHEKRCTYVDPDIFAFDGIGGSAKVSYNCAPAELYFCAGFTGVDARSHEHAFRSFCVTVLVVEIWKGPVWWMVCSEVTNVLI